MATLSAPGIGSGLDINGIVSQLVAVEQIPLQRLQAKSGAFLTQISAYGQLRAAMAGFQDAASALKDFNEINAFSAKSGDKDVFTVTSDNEVTRGRYDILVNSLAQSHKLGSKPFADSSTTLIGNPGEQVSISIGNESFSIEVGGKTLSQIQTAINEAADNVGVTAGIVQENENSFHLVLSSKDTGLENAISLTFTDGPGAAIADPLGFAQIQPAKDASITIDNAYTISRPSNTISDGIQGVTLELQAVSAEQVMLDISRNSGAAGGAVEKFVSAYNSLLSSLNQLGQGELKSDGTLRLVANQIRSVIGSRAALDDGPAYLSEVGISFDKDGSLSFKSSELGDAMEADLNRVADLFGHEAQGFASRLDAMLEGMLGAGGLIEARETGLNESVDSNNDQISAMQTRLELTEARYRAQFTALDGLLAQLQATSSFVTAQLSSLETLLPGNRDR